MHMAWAERSVERSTEALKVSVGAERVRRVRRRRPPGLCVYAPKAPAGPGGRASAPKAPAGPVRRRRPPGQCAEGARQGSALKAPAGSRILPWKMRQ